MSATAISNLVYLVDPDNPAEIEEASALNDRMVARALAMEGTCTGEHGVGYGKLGFMQAEHGEAVSVMRQIKLALDPNNLMNPGKLVRVLVDRVWVIHQVVIASLRSQ
ncbi:MAG: FAD-linked oxidase C-terminal domain-containing protein [Pseudomonadota bacterium]